MFLFRIDRKMSCSQTNYKLDEAQAIFNELRSIKKSISTGEKERQDLIQVTASFSLHPRLAQLQFAYLMLTSSVRFCLLFCSTHHKVTKLSDIFSSDKGADFNWR